MTDQKQKSSLDVQDALASSEAFMIKRKKQLIIAAVAIVVIVGGFFGYKYLIQAPKNEKEQTQLTMGIQLMNQIQQATAQSAQVLSMPDSVLIQNLRQGGMLTTNNPDSIALTVKNFRAQQQSQVYALYNQALKGNVTLIPGFNKFPGFLKIAKSGGTDASNIANYMAGICYYHLGQYSEAVKYLENFTPQGDQAVSPVAISALANSYACNKQIDKAVETFKNAAEEADNETLSPMYLVEAGKLLESQNKKADAHAIYEQVKKEYPKYGINQQGMYSSIIDKFIERTK